MAGGQRTELLWPALIVGAVAAVWRWRLEVGLVALPALAHGLLADAISDGAAWLVVIATLGVVLVVPWSRRRMTCALRAARVRRRWRRAWLDVGLPKVAAGRVAHVPAGELVCIRCSRGSSIPTVAANAERIAACLGAREVRIDRDPRHAARGTALLVRRDPLDGATAAWPLSDASGPLTLWGVVPVGVDELGRTVTMRLRSATCCWVASRARARAPRFRSCSPPRRWTRP
jgi:hypothetical protein